MSKATATQEKTASEVRTISVSFSGKLDSGELCTGTPTITEVTSSDLTLASKAVSTEILVINGVSTPIGEAVQCSVTGGTAGTTYEIKIAVSTDATPAQTLYGTIKLKVVSDTN